VNRLACLAHIDNQIDHQVDTEIQKFNYCCILIKSNQFQRAFNLLNEIDHFDLDPLDSESINLQLAYLSQKLGNLSAARSFYSLSYSSPLLLFLRDYNLNIMDSHSLLDAPVPDNLGFYQQAVIESNNLFLHPRNLDQALSRFPNNPKIILAKWKSVKPTTLAACLDLVAKYPASKVHLAKFHLDSNQPKMALEILEPLLSSFDSFVLHLYVNAMHCLDQLDLALNTLAALEQNQMVCIALAQAHLLQGNTSKALDCYESALESDIVLAQYIQMAANHDPSRILKYKDRLNVPRVQEYHLDDLLQLPKASKM
jgi:tetratricopeptide (TPR) repeat protein